MRNIQRSRLPPLPPQSSINFICTRGWIQKFHPLKNIPGFIFTDLLKIFNFSKSGNFYVIFPARSRKELSVSKSDNTHLRIPDQPTKTSYLVWFALFSTYLAILSAQMLCSYLLIFLNHPSHFGTVKLTSSALLLD